jgi:hypothetical protein
MNEDPITSRNNPKVKQVRSLRQRKQREATGLFLAEGIQPVGEAIQAAIGGKTGTSVEYIFYSPDLLTSDFAFQLVEEQVRQGTPCFSAPGDLFRTLVEKESESRVRRPRLSLRRRRREIALQLYNTKGVPFDLIQTLHPCLTLTLRLPYALPNNIEDFTKNYEFCNSNRKSRPHL